MPEINQDIQKEKKEPEKKDSEKKAVPEQLPHWVCCESAKVRNWKYRIYTCELHSYNFRSGDK
jgi:hypothetical protein